MRRLGWRRDIRFFLTRRNFTLLDAGVEFGTLRRLVVVVLRVDKFAQLRNPFLLDFVLVVDTL